MSETQTDGPTPTSAPSPAWAPDRERSPSAVVSQITTGYPTDENGRAYRRRRYVPAIVTVVKRQT